MRQFLLVVFSVSVFCGLFGVDVESAQNCVPGSFSVEAGELKICRHHGDGRTEYPLVSVFEGFLLEHKEASDVQKVMEALMGKDVTSIIEDLAAMHKRRVYRFRLQAKKAGDFKNLTWLASKLNHWQGLSASVRFEEEFSRRTRRSRWQRKGLEFSQLPKLVESNKKYWKSLRTLSCDRNHKELRPSLLTLLRVALSDGHRSLLIPVGYREKEAGFEIDIYGYSQFQLTKKQVVRIELIDENAYWSLVGSSSRYLFNPEAISQVTFEEIRPIYTSESDAGQRRSPICELRESLDNL